LIAAALFALSLLLAPFALTKANITILVVFVLGIGAKRSKIYYICAKPPICTTLTPNTAAFRFLTRPNRENGRPIRAVATDPFFVQSAMFHDSDELALNTPIIIISSNISNRISKNPAHRRRGLYVSARLSEKISECEIEVVEIDPQMTEIAKRFFKLEENPRLKIIHTKTAEFFSINPNQTLRRRFNGRLRLAVFSVPFQLTTVEAVQQISRVLKDDGVVIFNLGGAISGAGNAFLKSELATYRAIFPRVYLLKINPDYSDDHFQNPILTDDLAPVEYYNSFAQSNR
jgi:SAM-dependent methyltransferase